MVGNGGGGSKTTSLRIGREVGESNSMQVGKNSPKLLNPKITQRFKIEKENYKKEKKRKQL